MKVDRIWALVFAIPVLVLLASQSFAQADMKPVFAGYKGVMIGMPMTDARTKLGTAKDKSDTEDYYVYSDSESCQVQYGPDKTVRLMSINFVGKSAPKPMDILGMEIVVKPDGSINKIVRYPKSGYSISYLRTPGDDPVTMITVQKISPINQ
jgi:hypothetical protein